MGIYDRDYYREDEPRGINLGGNRSITVNLLLINAAIFILDLFLKGQMSAALALHADVIVHPWNAWQLLSYGFVHSHDSFKHIGFNMLALWFFGREVESYCGKKVFLQLYLSLTMLSGLVWVAATCLQNGIDSRNFSVVGASGAISGVLMIFIFKFPKRTLLLYFVIPIPAWLLGVFWIGGDMLGSLTSNSPVAFSAHLGGALFGFVFWKTGWHLGRLLPNNFSFASLKPRPRLRVHDPDQREQQYEIEADAILRKINEHGQESLTKKEKKILEQYSRRMQQKHR